MRPGPYKEQKLLARRLLEENKSVSEIAKTFNVHKATIYRLCVQERQMLKYQQFPAIKNNEEN